MGEGDFILGTKQNYVNKNMELSFAGMETKLYHVLREFYNTYRAVNLRFSGHR